MTGMPCDRAYSPDDVWWADIVMSSRQPQDIPRVMEIAKIFRLEFLPLPNA